MPRGTEGRPRPSPQPGWLGLALLGALLLGPAGSSLAAPAWGAQTAALALPGIPGGGEPPPRPAPAVQEPRREDELGKAAVMLRKKAAESPVFWERGSLLQRSETLVRLEDVQGVWDDLVGLALAWRDFVAGLADRYARLTAGGIARFIGKSFGALLLLVLAMVLHGWFGAWMARRKERIAQMRAEARWRALLTGVHRLAEAAAAKLFLLGAVYLSLEIISWGLPASATWVDAARRVSVVVLGGLAVYGVLRELVRHIILPPGEAMRPFGVSPEAAESIRPAVLHVLSFLGWTLIPIASFEAAAYRPGFVALLWTVFWIGMVMLILTVASREVLHFLIRPVTGQEKAERLLSAPIRAYRMGLLGAMGFLLLLYALGYRNLTQYLIVGILLSGFILAAGRGLIGRAEAWLGALLAPEAPLPHRMGLESGQRERLSRMARALARYAISAGVLVTLLVLWGVDLYALAWVLSILVTPAGSVGGVPISIANVLKVGLIFGAFVWLSRYLRHLIHTRLDESFAGEDVRGNIAIGVRYLVLTLGAIAALKSVGVDFTTLTIFAGVIGVGVGFGLQTVANNLISGIILLLERTVKPTDFIEVGNTTGIVQQVTLRSTIIRTLDNISVIVPNSNFISNTVINWSHGDKVIRGRIPVGVAYGSDLEKVRRALAEAASAHPLVLKTRPPQVVFTGFGDSALSFELLYWVNEPRNILFVKSDLLFAIEAAFRREGIRIPFPQREVHLYRADPPPAGEAPPGT